MRLKNFPTPLLLALLSFSPAAPAASLRVLDARFNRADANRDTFLSPFEFLALETGFVRWTDAMHRFNRADDDGDGQLGQLEFRASNGGNSGGRPSRLATFLLADIDENGSLDAEEYARTLPKSRNWRSVMLDFGRRDRDDDGLVSRREFGIFAVAAR